MKGPRIGRLHSTSFVENNFNMTLLRCTPSTKSQTVLFRAISVSFHGEKTKYSLRILMMVVKKCSARSTVYLLISSFSGFRSSAAAAAIAPDMNIKGYSRSTESMAIYKSITIYRNLLTFKVGIGPRRDTVSEHEVDHELVHVVYSRCCVLQKITIISDSSTRRIAALMVYHIQVHLDGNNEPSLYCAKVFT